MGSTPTKLMVWLPAVTLNAVVSVGGVAGAGGGEGPHHHAVDQHLDLFVAGVELPRWAALKLIA